MQTTNDLLTSALKIKKATAWASELNLTRQTFANAKRKGRLSPVLAGSLAINMGENPEHWIAIAAMEAEPASPLLDLLKAKFKECRFS